jgi:hypothetical protein
MLSITDIICGIANRRGGVLSVVLAAVVKFDVTIRRHRRHLIGGVVFIDVFIEEVVVVVVVVVIDVVVVFVDWVTITQ